MFATISFSFLYFLIFLNLLFLKCNCCSHNSVLRNLLHTRFRAISIIGRASNNSSANNVTLVWPYIYTCLWGFRLQRKNREASSQPLAWNKMENFTEHSIQYRTGTAIFSMNFKKLFSSFNLLSGLPFMCLCPYALLQLALGKLSVLVRWS